MAGRTTVFDAIVASKTTEFFTLRGLEPSVAAGSLILEVVGASTPNWTLDIQGKVHESGVYVNIDYIQVYQAGAAGLSNGQLTVNDATRRFYLIPYPPPLVQLVSVRTGGNLTVHASFLHLAFTPTPLITSRGAVFTEGPIADDVAAAGNPVQIGGVAIEVDSSDPGSVAAADAAFLRTDLNRRLLVSAVHPNYFNVQTTITVQDLDTVVIPAGDAGLRTFITDMVITSGDIAVCELTDDAGTVIFGMIAPANVPVVVHFSTPLVNETASNQVEFDKQATKDNWRVYLAGYYAP